MKEKASHILMIQPVAFGFNDQTSMSNAFQKNTVNQNAADIQNKALEEFNAFVSILKSNGIHVDVFVDTINPHTPDSIFPNNWISFHENKLIVLFPMLAENRRLERRNDIVEHYKRSHSEILNLWPQEDKYIFLEGTGSIVFDYENKIAFANHSPRTNPELFLALCKTINYTSVLFHAIDKNENEIYHTNVLMCIGKGFAVLCKDCIPDKNELKKLENLFIKNHLELIEISYSQMNAFAGNMYQLFNDNGESFIVMSEQAFNSLEKSQIETLEKHGTLLHSPLDTIETYGGGSARCMLADIRN